MKSGQRVKERKQFVQKKSRKEKKSKETAA